MKTQIITLESHDDLISVRDRMAWAKTPRILLVWPKYEQVSLRVLDLKVLQRQADSLGAQLGLVTRRLNVRRDAEALGIPVFVSTGVAQRDSWPERGEKRHRDPRPPRRGLRALRDSVHPEEPAWRTSLAGRGISFMVGVAAVLAIAGLFVPRAALTLYPESLVQSAAIPVSASEQAETVSVTGSIPARLLTVRVSAEQSLAVTSQISVPESKAQGVVRFTNLSQSGLTIPAGTLVRTATDPPVRFTTLHETRLPAGPDESAETPVVAVFPGVEANVDSDSVIVVEGPLGLYVAVTNPESMTDGADARTVGATDADRDRLRRVVMQNLLRAAEAEMRAGLSQGDLLLMDTLRASKVLEETFDPPAGQPGKTLILRAEVEFISRYISSADLNQLSLATLDAAIAPGFTPAESPVLEPLAEPLTGGDGVTRFELKTTRTLLRQIDPAGVNALVRGQAPSRALEMLSAQYSLREAPDIDLRPSWWPWLPLIPFNMTIDLR